MKPCLFNSKHFILIYDDTWCSFSLKTQKVSGLTLQYANIILGYDCNQLSKTWNAESLTWWNKLVQITMLHNMGTSNRVAYRIISHYYQSLLSTGFLREVRASSQKPISFHSSCAIRDPSSDVLISLENRSALWECQRRNHWKGRFEEIKQGYLF